MENSKMYTIWVFSYDNKGFYLGDHWVGDYGSDADGAVAAAKKLVDDPVKLKKYAHPAADYVQVEVETVVEIDDWTENEESIFIKNIKI